LPRQTLIVLYVYASQEPSEQRRLLERGQHQPQQHGG
jgi:hypothetical protein